MNSRAAQANVIPEVERVLRAVDYLRQSRQLQKNDLRAQLDTVLQDFRDYRGRVQQKLDELEARLSESLNTTASEPEVSESESSVALEAIESQCSELRQQVSNSGNYQTLHGKLTQLRVSAARLPPIFVPRREASSKLANLLELEAVLDELAKQTRLESPGELSKTLYDLHFENDSLKVLRKHPAACMKIEAIDQRDPIVLAASPVAETGFCFSPEITKAFCISDCRNRKLKRFNAFENRCEILYEAVCDVGAFCLLPPVTNAAALPSYEMLALLEVEKTQTGARKHVVQLLDLRKERPVAVDGERYVLQDTSRYQDSSLFVRRLGANSHSSSNQSAIAASSSARTYLYVAVYDFCGVHELQVTASEADGSTQLQFVKVHPLAQNVKLRCVSFAAEHDLLACSCSDNRLRVLEWHDRDARQLVVWEPVNMKNSFLKQVLVVKKQQSKLVLLVEDFSATDKCILQCTVDFRKSSAVAVQRLTQRPMEVDCWLLMPNFVLSDLRVDDNNRFDNQQLLVFSSKPVNALTVYHLP